MVGVAGDKAALLHDYLAEPRRRRASPSRSTASRACRTRTCSTSVGSPSCSATTARSTRSTIPSRPAATASSAASRGSRSSWCRTSSREFRGLDEILAATDPELEIGRGRRGDPGEGHPRGPSPAAGDQPRGPLPADLTIVGPGRRGPLGRRRTPSTETDRRADRGPRDRARDRAHRVRDRRQRRLSPSRGRPGRQEGSRRTILGEVREYLTIKILHNDMTVMVPTRERRARPASVA